VLEDFAERGLRTLAVARRELDVATVTAVKTLLFFSLLCCVFCFVSVWRADCSCRARRRAASRAKLREFGAKNGAGWLCGHSGRAAGQRQAHAADADGGQETVDHLGRQGGTEEKFCLQAISSLVVLRRRRLCSVCCADAAYRRCARRTDSATATATARCILLALRWRDFLRGYAG
jgi:hypothetical protein